MYKSHHFIQDEFKCFADKEIEPTFASTKQQFY